MRTFVIAMAAAMAATSATAMDLPVAGLTLNTDVVAEYKVDAETTAITIEPEFAFTPAAQAGLELTAGTELSAYNNTDGLVLFDEFDTLPTIDFGASYAPGTMTNVLFEVGTSYDFEAQERSEVTLTATFSF